ncbi:hypothetical protein [Scytonema sp. PCC 10023]|uniref:hypothetical protein n=1 Tax=Scytonema sp. PCC 10023 TaxID=1680591 RepID=UPI0039C752AA
MSNSSALPGHSLLLSQIESANRQQLQQSIVDDWPDVSFAMLLSPTLQLKGTLEFILPNQNDKGSWGDKGYILHCPEFCGINKFPSRYQTCFSAKTLECDVQLLEYWLKM